MTAPALDFETSLAGRTLLLTGATGSIASAIARLAAARGANLVLTDLHEPPLHDLAADCAPARSLVFAANLRDPAAATQVVERARAQFGTIDMLIPAAGIYRQRRFSDMQEQEWRETMEVNLDAVYRIIRAAIPVLSDRSAIVNITSIAAHRGSAEHSHYAATKGALLSLTRSLAMELAPRTRVNSLSPGIIRTPMVDDLLAAKGAALIAATPLARLGEPEEVARATLFLASDAASFITGETLHVNGGLYMD